MFINTIENKTLVRRVRDIIDFFSHKTVFKPSVDGSNSQLHVNVGDAALPKTIDSPGQAGMRQASKLIDDGGEFIRTPMKWMKDMQENWHIYMICAAVICLCLSYLYCMARRYFARKQNSNTGFTSQLADIAVIMANSRNNQSSNLNKQITSDTTSSPS